MCVLGNAMLGSGRTKWTNLSSDGTIHYFKTLSNKSGIPLVDVTVMRRASDVKWRLIMTFRRRGVALAPFVESMGLPVHGDWEVDIVAPWTITMEISGFEACALEATHVAGYLTAYGQLKPPEKEQA